MYNCKHCNIPASCFARKRLHYMTMISLLYHIIHEKVSASNSCTFNAMEKIPWTFFAYYDTINLNTLPVLFILNLCFIKVAACIVCHVVGWYTIVTLKIVLYRLTSILYDNVNFVQNNFIDISIIPYNPIEVMGYFIETIQWSLHYKTTLQKPPQENHPFHKHKAVSLMVWSHIRCAMSTANNRAEGG